MLRTSLRIGVSVHEDRIGREFLSSNAQDFIEDDVFDVFGLIGAIPEQ